MMVIPATNFNISTYITIIFLIDKAIRQQFKINIKINRCDVRKYKTVNNEGLLLVTLVSFTEMRYEIHKLNNIECDV